MTSRLANPTRCSILFSSPSPGRRDPRSGSSRNKGPDLPLSLPLSFLSGVLTQLIRSRCHFEKVYKEEKASADGRGVAVRGVAHDSAARRDGSSFRIVKPCGPSPSPPPSFPLPLFFPLIPRVSIGTRRAACIAPSSRLRRRYTVGAL